MWNESNPTSLWLGTTWELISSGKYIQTGNTALQTGGSNSFKIEKTNLPNIKLRTDSTTTTTNEHEHYIANNSASNTRLDSSLSLTYTTQSNDWANYILRGTSSVPTVGKSSRAGGGTTGSFSLLTEAMGSGAPINIQPSYITLKFWKRTS